MPPLAPNRPLKHHKPHPGIPGVRPRIPWAVRLPWGLQILLLCSKNISNPWVGTNMVLFVPSYEDKWHTMQARIHHFAQNGPSYEDKGHTRLVCGHRCAIIILSHGRPIPFVHYVMGGGWDLYIQRVNASAITARPAWKVTSTYFS